MQKQEYSDENRTISVHPGQAFLGDNRSSSGLGLGDGLVSHTSKWLQVGSQSCNNSARGMLRLHGDEHCCIGPGPAVWGCSCSGWAIPVLSCCRGPGRTVSCPLANNRCRREGVIKWKWSRRACDMHRWTALCQATPSRRWSIFMMRPPSRSMAQWLPPLAVRLLPSPRILCILPETLSFGVARSYLRPYPISHMFGAWPGMQHVSVLGSPGG